MSNDYRFVVRITIETNRLPPRSPARVPSRSEIDRMESAFQAAIGTSWSGSRWTPARAASDGDRNCKVHTWKNLRRRPRRRVAEALQRLWLDPCLSSRGGCARLTSKKSPAAPEITSALPCKLDLSWRIETNRIDYGSFQPFETSSWAAFVGQPQSNRLARSDDRALDLDRTSVDAVIGNLNVFDSIKSEDL
jgi:hypothetical protein